MFHQSAVDAYLRKQTENSINIWLFFILGCKINRSFETLFLIFQHNPEVQSFLNAKILTISLYFFSPLNPEAYKYPSSTQPFLEITGLMAGQLTTELLHQVDK